jgi:hypothetical protein
MVMGEACVPIRLTDLDSYPFKATCAVVGWCSESWLLADEELSHKALDTLTCALRHYCEPWAPAPAPGESALRTMCSKNHWSFVGT